MKPSKLIKIIITILEGKEEEEIHHKELIIELQSKEIQEETILEKIQKNTFQNNNQNTEIVNNNQIKQNENSIFLSNPIKILFKI